MIDFEFLKPPQPGAAFGKLTVKINQPEMGVEFPFKCPLTFQVRSQISKKINWSCKLSPGHWATYFEPFNSNFELIDADNKVITIWSWDLLQHGDDSHKVFYSWSLNNKGAKGISIGTHNGETGEWVNPVREGLISAVLVEASQKQYNELVENYKDFENVDIVKSLVTTDGSEYEFYEEEKGFTNSIIKSHTEIFGQATPVKMSSISINDLIISKGLAHSCDWLHLDVEGIDSDLIFSLDESRITLPKLILYESLNFNQETKVKTSSYLESKGYRVQEFGGWNTIAIKN